MNHTIWCDWLVYGPARFGAVWLGRVGTHIILLGQARFNPVRYCKVHCGRVWNKIILSGKAMCDVLR